MWCACRYGCARKKTWYGDNVGSTEPQQRQEIQSMRYHWWNSVVVGVMSGAVGEIRAPTPQRWWMKQRKVSSSVSKKLIGCHWVMSWKENRDFLQFRNTFWIFKYLIVRHKMKMSRLALGQNRQKRKVPLPQQKKAGQAKETRKCSIETVSTAIL